MKPSNSQKNDLRLTIIISVGKKKKVERSLITLVQLVLAFSILESD